jgi:hypothetical protein
MPTKFISTLPREGLYCVWVATGDPRRPLACIWIDPQMRSYQFESVRSTSAGGVTQTGNESEMCRDRKPKSSRRLVISNVSRQWRTSRTQVARWIALVVVMLSVLCNPAWADVGGRIAGVVTDSSDAFLPASYRCSHQYQQRNQTDCYHQRSGTIFVSRRSRCSALKLVRDHCQPTSR